MWHISHSEYSLPEIMLFFFYCFFFFPPRIWIFHSLLAVLQFLLLFSELRALSMLLHELVSIYLLSSFPCSFLLRWLHCCALFQKVQPSGNGHILMWSFPSAAETSTASPCLFLACQLSSGAALTQSLWFKRLRSYWGESGLGGMRPTQAHTWTAFRANVVPVLKETGAVSGIWASFPCSCRQLLPTLQGDEVLIHRIGRAQQGHLAWPLASFASFLLSRQLLWACKWGLFMSFGSVS